MVASCPLAGALMRTFFAPALWWIAALSRSVKRPVHSRTMSTPELLPRQLRRVLLGEHLDALAGELEAVLVRVRLLLRAAVHGVEVVQVGERLGVGQVVDGDELEASRVAFVHRAHDAATDTAEAVDGDLDGHEAFLRKKSPFVYRRRGCPASGADPDALGALVAGKRQGPPLCVETAGAGPP